MSQITHLDGIRTNTVATPRGRFHILETGSPEGNLVLLIHGNLCSSVFWEETMCALPPNLWIVAPDMRGYGESETLPVDAVRGLRDFSDDIASIANALGKSSFHLVGHSLGGTITMQYAVDYTPTLQSLTLIAPGSPYGFGGTRDNEGTPCWPDYAGSGGGLIHPELLQRLRDHDRSEENPFSPRTLLCTHLCNPPFRPPREDMLVEAMLLMSTSDDNYSRDMLPSSNWPGFAPGTRGVNNALSPKYCDISSLATLSPPIPIHWIRGTEDHVVSDASRSEPGTLGALGLIPNWPGNEVYPSQPMVSQTRAVLERYKQHGGTYQEHIIDGVGHMPHIEAPDAVNPLLQRILT
jgi:pimeloyl-ACP methyl ester carboxylesterase